MLDFCQEICGKRYRKTRRQLQKTTVVLEGISRQETKPTDFRIGC